MNFTKWFKLRKPEQEEFYDVDDFNFNADILDTELKNVKDSYLPLTGGTVKNSYIESSDKSGVFRLEKETGGVLFLCDVDSTNYMGGAILRAIGKDAQFKDLQIKKQQQPQQTTNIEPNSYGNLSGHEIPFGAMHGVKAPKVDFLAEKFRLAGIIQRKIDEVKNY